MELRKTKHKTCDVVFLRCIHIFYKGLITIRIERSFHGGKQFGFRDVFFLKYQVGGSAHIQWHSHCRRTQHATRTYAPGSCIVARQWKPRARAAGVLTRQESDCTTLFKQFVSIFSLLCNWERILFPCRPHWTKLTHLASGDSSARIGNSGLTLHSQKRSALPWSQYLICMLSTSQKLWNSINFPKTCFHLIWSSGLPFYPWRIVT